ncbi:hypothetical protein DPMN_159741 [Dreissena polymorpha]|uniref:Uncharacterized protein n=1 Tax=Dreissena polymorpha TaxID=45954 RepID=A0A9D4IQZ2_DREPO|nr:hypothetical protein DPMN_159741 [Dreissena polymorpha]
MKNIKFCKISQQQANRIALIFDNPSETHLLDGDLSISRFEEQFCTYSRVCLLYKPSHVSLFNGFQERLLRSNKCFSYVPGVRDGLVLCVGDSKQSPDILWFKCLYPAFCVSVKRPCLAVVDYDGGYDGLVEPELD